MRTLSSGCASLLQVDWCWRADLMLIEADPCLFSIPEGALVNTFQRRILQGFHLPCWLHDVTLVLLRCSLPSNGLLPHTSSLPLLPGPQISCCAGFLCQPCLSASQQQCPFNQRQPLVSPPTPCFLLPSCLGVWDSLSDHLIR